MPAMPQAGMTDASNLVLGLARDVRMHRLYFDFLSAKPTSYKCCGGDKADSRKGGLAKRRTFHKISACRFY